jgi:hypothetical protein
MGWRRVGSGCGGGLGGEEGVPDRFVSEEEQTVPFDIESEPTMSEANCLFLTTQTIFGLRLPK